MQNQSNRVMTCFTTQFSVPCIPLSLVTTSSTSKYATTTDFHLRQSESHCTLNDRTKQKIWRVQRTAAEHDTEIVSRVGLYFPSHLWLPNTRRSDIWTETYSPWARYRNPHPPPPPTHTHTHGDFWRQWFLNSSVCVFSISACLHDELLCF